MIDAALAATIAAPVTPGGEPAPAEGFGDLLSQMLGTAAQPTAESQEPADALDALAAAHAAAQAAATVAAAVVPAGGAHPGKGRGDVAEHAVIDSTGQAAASAWQASPAARAHASAHSAVVLAAAAQAAIEAARQSLGQDTAAMTETAVAEASVQAIQDTAHAVAAAGAEGDAAAAVEAVVVTAEAAEAALVATEAQVTEAQADAAQTDAGQVGSRAASDPRRVQASDHSPAIGADVAVGEQAPPVKAAGNPARGAQRVEPAAPPVGVDGGASPAADHAARAAELRPAGPSTELFASGALRRVMEAVEAAEHRPPPNTMAVEIPGEGAEGALRLMVSVRGSVVEITAQGDRVLPPGWARPLAEALAERGMSLDGFGGQDAAGRQDGAAEGRDGQAARDERAAARRAGVPAGAQRPSQLTSTGHDGALRL